MVRFRANPTGLDRVKRGSDLSSCAKISNSPILGLLGDVHREVAQGDLNVQDSRHGMGHQEVASPRPGSLAMPPNKLRTKTKRHKLNETKIWCLR